MAGIIPGERDASVLAEIVARLSQVQETVSCPSGKRVISRTPRVGAAQSRSSMPSP